MGNAYGPRGNWRLLAATSDLRELKKDDTWYLVTTLPLQGGSPREVYETYCPSDWIEHYYKPVKQELGWADFQTRDAEAIVRHWQLVMLAFTFSLLTEAPPAGWVRQAAQDTAVGEKIGTPRRVAGDAAEGAGLALSLGADQPLLADLVPRPGTARIGRTPDTPRPLSSP